MIIAKAPAFGESKPRRKSSPREGSGFHEIHGVLKKNRLETWKKTSLGKFEEASGIHYQQKCCKDLQKMFTCRKCFHVYLNYVDAHRYTSIKIS